MAEERLLLGLRKNSPKSSPLPRRHSGAGLTQEQLAGRTETTQSVIARLESGRTGHRNRNEIANQLPA
jgi:predicted transcriptional regulator